MHKKQLSGHFIERMSISEMDATTTMPSTASKRPKPKFEQGEIIAGRWKVIRKLGSGGFGIVYEVKILCGRPKGIHAALKAEAVNPKKRRSETLVAEALVLRRMQWSQHFCTLYMAARLSPECNIIVMSLVGRPLSWLRRQNPSQCFTLSTALRLGIQCLEAIMQLHSIGIIHRDVKGSNFAIGLGDQSKTVRMIDFGFARLYLKVDEYGHAYHRNPRRRAPFLGTDLYCSAHAHMHREQGRRDDLWSFFYMLVEFIDGKLPWRDCPTKELMQMKFMSRDHLLRKCPYEFYKIYDYIKYLRYKSRPDYEYINSILTEVRKRKHISMNEPFDWEEGGRYHKEHLEAVKKEEEKKRAKEKNNEKKETGH